MGARGGLDGLLYLLDEAFGGRGIEASNESQALLANLATVTDDGELGRPRPTNWGEERETRWIVAAMVTHDAYHAGEINHIRSLLQGDDRWRDVQMGFG
jgi:hypothetical protein